MTARPTLTIIAALALTGCNMATPPLVITNDGGGYVAERKDQIDRLERFNRPVVIDGKCGSACVLHLKSRATCITPRSTVVVHNVKFGARHPDAGQISEVGNFRFQHDFRLDQPNLKRFFADCLRRIDASGICEMSGAQLIAMGEVREC